MGGKMAIGAGLLAGILVGGVAMGAAVALLPTPPPPDGPARSTAVPATPVPSSPATASPSASPTASPSPSAVASPSAASAARDTGIGTVAPDPGLTGFVLSLAGVRGRPVWVDVKAAPSCPDRATSWRSPRAPDSTETALSAQEQTGRLPRT